MSLETPVGTPIPNNNFESDYAETSYELNPHLHLLTQRKGENINENSHESFGEAASVGESQGD